MPSYEKNKASGLWSCRFREKDENGISHNKRLSGFATKREAQYGYEDYIKTAEERENARIKAEKANKSESDSMLFEDLAASYLAFTKKRVKESSYYDIESKMRTKMIPYFIGKRMCDIKPKMISDWIENVEYSYASKKFILSTLSSIYKYGEKYFDIQNIMPKVDRPRNLEPKKEMQVWSPDEFKSFINCVENPVFSALFTTLYLTGCRRNEATALTWEDINFESKTIRINKSVTHKTEKGSFAITTPKNQGSVRTVSIPSSLSEQLYRLKNNAQQGEFVFGGNRPVPKTNIDTAFKSAINKSKVKRIRIHDLRHSCASLLISKGVSIVAVSRRLGHTSTQQTLNTYSHLMPDDQTRILNILDTIKI